MLMKDNEFLQEAVQSLYVANADEIVRQQCIARADAERRERTLVRDNNRLKQQLTQLQQEHSDQTIALAEKDREIAELNAKIALLNAAHPNIP